MSSCGGRRRRGQGSCRCVLSLSGVSCWRGHVSPSPACRCTQTVPWCECVDSNDHELHVADVMMHPAAVTVCR